MDVMLTLACLSLAKVMTIYANANIANNVNISIKCLELTNISIVAEKQTGSNFMLTLAKMMKSNFMFTLAINGQN